MPGQSYDVPNTHKIGPIKMVVAVFTAVLTLAFTGAAVTILVLHLGIRPVLSGSMRPTYAPGWAIITKQIPVTSLRPGDIVVFTPPGEGVEYAHRVLTVTDSASGPVITTKGDANPAADPWHARLDRSATIPEVVAEVPALGTAMVDLEHRRTHVLLVVITGLGVCLLGTRAILRGAREKLA